MELTEKSRAILEAIAKGHTYEQILVQDLAWTYHDIFQAAAETLETATTSTRAKTYDVDELREDHPRAYQPWTSEEDEQLRQLFRSGATVNEIGNTLKRQTGAIRNRLGKLNFLTPGSSAET